MPRAETVINVLLKVKRNKLEKFRRFIVFNMLIIYSVQCIRFHVPPKRGNLYRDPSLKPHIHINSLVSSN